MAKNTSMLLGDHFEAFINTKVQNGRFSSASEVVRAGLRLLEAEETKLDNLRQALIIGEESGFIDDFDRVAFKKKLHQKYLGNDA